MIVFVDQTCYIFCVPIQCLVSMTFITFVMAQAVGAKPVTFHRQVRDMWFDMMHIA